MIMDSSPALGEILVRHSFGSKFLMITGFHGTHVTIGVDSS